MIKRISMSNLGVFVDQISVRKMELRCKSDQTKGICVEIQPVSSFSFRIWYFFNNSASLVYLRPFSVQTGMTQW